MHSLFITPMLPASSEQDRGGKHRRAGVFLRALARVSDTVRIVYIVPLHMMALASDPVALNRSQSNFWGVELAVTLIPRATRRQTMWNYYIAGILSAGAQHDFYPYVGDEVVAQIGRLLDTSPDCVMVDRLDVMLPILASGRKPAGLFFDIDDLYHKVLLRKLLNDPWHRGKLPLAMQVPALIQAERRAIAQSTMTFACSDADAAHMRRLGCRGTIQVVPNTIVPPDRVPGVAASRNVLFLGSMHHGPNRAAAERLVNRIWPMVRQHEPDARLIIAGAFGPAPLATEAEPPGVAFVGFADDLDALYASARVICSPIMHGSGTRLKLVEAAAYARPMVSTAVGAEGLAFQDGRDILLRESDADLAEACVSLLRDDALCERLGANARATMLDLYDGRTIETRVAELLSAAAPGGRRLREARAN